MGRSFPPPSTSIHLGSCGCPLCASLGCLGLERCSGSCCPSLVPERERRQRSPRSCGDTGASQGRSGKTAWRRRHVKYALKNDQEEVKARRTCTVGKGKVSGHETAQSTGGTTCVQLALRGETYMETQLRSSLQAGRLADVGGKPWVGWGREYDGGAQGAKVGLAEQSPRLPSIGWMMPVSRPEPGWGEGSRWRERRESGCEVRPPGRGTIQPGRPLLSQRLVPTSSKSWRDAS